MSSAYSLSCPYVPEKPLSDLVLSVKQECHQPLTDAFPVGKTQHLQTGFMPDSTAQKAPYDFLQQPREGSEPRFKEFFAMAVSSSDQVGDGRRKSEDPVLRGAGLVCKHSLLSALLANRQRTPVAAIVLLQHQSKNTSCGLY